MLTQVNEYRMLKYFDIHLNLIIIYGTTAGYAKHNGLIN